MQAEDHGIENKYSIPISTALDAEASIATDKNQGISTYRSRKSSERSLPPTPMGEQKALPSSPEPEWAPQIQSVPHLRRNATVRSNGEDSIIDSYCDLKPSIPTDGGRDLTCTGADTVRSAVEQFEDITLTGDRLKLGQQGEMALASQNNQPPTEFYQGQTTNQFAALNDRITSLQTAVQILSNQLTLNDTTQVLGSTLKSVNCALRKIEVYAEKNGGAVECLGKKIDGLQNQRPGNFGDSSGQDVQALQDIRSRLESCLPQIATKLDQLQAAHCASPGSDEVPAAVMNNSKPSTGKYASADGESVLVDPRLLYHNLNDLPGTTNNRDSVYARQSSEKLDRILDCLVGLEGQESLQGEWRTHSSRCMDALNLVSLSRYKLRCSLFINFFVALRIIFSELRL
jgi:hypothetical protein